MKLQQHKESSVVVEELPTGAYQVKRRDTGEVLCVALTRAVAQLTAEAVDQLVRPEPQKRGLVA